MKVPSSPLYKELGILKLQDIYELTTLIFVYESLNALNPSQFHTYFKFPCNTRNTAANRNDNLDTPMVSSYGLKSIRYSGCILWNKLSTKERTADTKNIFKKNTKLRLVGSY